MKHKMSIANRFGWFLCVPFVFGVAGCNEKPVGPKRADHEAAHSSRYHPDISRQTTTITSAPDVATTQPATSETIPDASTLTGPIGCPVLFVNGQTITVQEVLEPIIDDLKKEAGSLALRTYQASLYRRITSEIQNQVNTLLIYEEAKKTFPEKANEYIDKEVDKQIKNIINARFDGVHAKYEAHLKSLRLSMNDAKGRIKRQIMVRQFLHQKFRTILREPSRRELMKYYQAHLDEFTTPQKAELFLIEIPLQTELDQPLSKASPNEITTARQRAVETLRRAREELESGIEFSAVAKHYSKGIRKNQGGAWGEMSPGALTKRWAQPAEVLFTLKAGEISDVIETNESVFLVKCGKRNPAYQQSFEEAQKHISDRLKDEEFHRSSAAYVGRLLKEATVLRQRDFLLAVVAAAPRPPSRELTSESGSLAPAP